jgi:hypothetical protein
MILKYQKNIKLKQKNKKNLNFLKIFLKYKNKQESVV